MKQKQEEEERQGTMTEETTPIQEQNQLAAEGKSEYMQGEDLAQPIKDLIKVADMELGPEWQDEDIGLMLNAPHIIVQPLPPPATELALSNDHASPTFSRERVIVVDTSRNLNTTVEANLAFTSTIRSNTEYLRTESKKLIQNIQVSRQGIEKLH